MMMNKIEMQKYINERIHNKMYAKNHHAEYEVNYYFKNRHTGLANIDNEQVVALVYGAIRDLRVWRKIEMLCTTNNFIK